MVQDVDGSGEMVQDFDGSGEMVQGGWFKVDGGMTQPGSGYMV